MRPGENIAVELAECVSPATIIRRDEPMIRHTTLRVGGPADIYVEPVSETDLVAVVIFCGARGVPFIMIGRGSNLLVRDGGFRGAIICLPTPSSARLNLKASGCVAVQE